MCSVFEKLMEAIAHESIASAKLFINKVLTEVKCIGAPQLEANSLPDQDDYQAVMKVGSNGLSQQIIKKTKANTIKELLHGIKKTLPILKLI